MTRKEELAIKLNRVRTLMETLKLDGVYLKRQDDFSWLSCGGQNYLGWGEMGLCGLLVTADNTYAVTNAIERPRMIDEERLEEMGFAVHSAVWHELDFEARTLKQLVPSGRLGTDFNSPLGTNIEGEIKTLRLSLTEAEVGRIKEVGYWATLAMEEAAVSLRPGITEIEATKRIAMALYDQGMEFTSLMCAADERLYNYRHAIATENKIRERVQIGGNMRKWGLTVCLTRYVNFVPVTEELRRQYRLNQLIDCTLMEKTVVGRPYNEPLLAAKALYEEHGYADEFDKHHLGGPIGYANRDYRVDPTMLIPVVENQAFCWNPSITGTKSEDTILVTTNGFEFLTRAMLFPKNEVRVGDNTYIRPDILEKY
ncbi:MAG TPA: aminopeptidase P family N-terminal domain-containing protein [Sphaerochaeta sp.]|jgi:Xaa-Pro dipeptidase|nr:aminopeptidase P family N-terminal domain-containing protein [Sphaerochaeta sp.]